MYDDYYSRLLNGEKTFYPRDGNEIIRILVQEVRSNLTRRESGTEGTLSFQIRDTHGKKLASKTKISLQTSPDW